MIPKKMSIDKVTNHILTNVKNNVYEVEKFGVVDITILRFLKSYKGYTDLDGNRYIIIRKDYLIFREKLKKTKNNYNIGDFIYKDFYQFEKIYNYSYDKYAFSMKINNDLFKKHLTKKN